MPVMPQSAWEAIHKAKMIARMLDVPHASTVNQDGLYIGSRKRRDPVNNNRKRAYMTVRLRRDGKEIFREDVPTTGFPSDHLIAQLMLLI